MSSGRPQRLWAIGRRLATEWRDDRVPDLAAEVAFYAILSLFPALLALAALLGILESLVGAEVAVETQTEAISFLRTILTSEANTTIEAVTDLFTESRPGLLTFSLLAALWALSRGFAALVRALDVVYDLTEERAWLRIRGTALGLAVGSIVAGAVMLSVLVVGPLFGTGEEIADEVGLGDAFVFLWDVFRLPVAFLMLVLWAATIFHLAPNHRTPWRNDVPGALVTGVLWVLFSGALRAYVEIAQRGNAVFGALGGVLIVMLWFWLLSLAVLIGAEVNQILEADRSGPVEGVAQRLDELPGVHRAPAVEQDPHDG
jgi:membrane protein